MTDVCPLTLGTEVVSDNGYFEHYLPFIKRNTVIPVSNTHKLYTTNDYQASVRVKILQGKSRLARNNLYLGELCVPVPSKPRGEESIEVTYTYDINSLLEVKVKVCSTGVEKAIIIRGEGNTMSEAEAEKRMQELSYLKISPREQEENKLALYMAELAYESTTGDMRIYIDRAISDFEKALQRGKSSQIDKARKELIELLETIK